MDVDDIIPGLEEYTFQFEHHTSQADLFEEETAGLEPHYVSDATKDVELNDDNENMCLLDRMGVSDVESVKIHGGTFMASALNNLVRSNKKPDMIMFRGDQPINEYNNPDLMMGMFPTLFPLGISGFEFPEWPTCLSSV